MDFQNKHFQHFVPIGMVLKSHLEFAQSPNSCMYMHPHATWMDFSKLVKTHLIKPFPITLQLTMIANTKQNIYTSFSAEKP